MPGQFKKRTPPSLFRGKMLFSGVSLPLPSSFFFSALWESLLSSSSLRVARPGARSLSHSRGSEMEQDRTPPPRRPSSETKEGLAACIHSQTFNNVCTWHRPHSDWTDLWWLHTTLLRKHGTVQFPFYLTICASEVTVWSPRKSQNSHYANRTLGKR